MSRAGRKKYGKGASYSGQWVGHLLEMLESPAWRVLSRAAHQVLSRIEVELCYHGGSDNGDLIVTYEQFVRYGIGRKQIGPAIRELEKLGFIVVTERGAAGNANEKAPNKFRLTYRGSSGQHAVMGDGSHEWRGIQSMKEAKAIAKAARATKPERRYRYSRQRGAKGQTYWRPQK
jgi:hypothetical protein